MLFFPLRSHETSVRRMRAASFVHLLPILIPLLRICLGGIQHINALADGGLALTPILRGSFGRVCASFALLNLYVNLRTSFIRAQISAFALMSMVFVILDCQPLETCNVRLVRAPPGNRFHE